MSDYYYKADAVRDLAEGNWLVILNHIAANELHEALKKPGRHVHCPVHRGKHGDAFRLFKDAHKTGGGICNTCGPKHDGFELLMWIKGWSFDTCLKVVGDAVGAERNFFRKKDDSIQSESTSNAKPKGKGILVASGTAPYHNNEDNEQSYFLTLRNKYGRERTFWGIDLPRALEKSKAVVGDLISLNFCGRKAVTIEQPVRDADGTIVDYKEVSSHRNEWQIINHTQSLAKGSDSTSESSDLVDSAPSKPAMQAVQMHDVGHEQRKAIPPESKAGKLISLSQMEVPEFILQATKRLERMEERRKAYGSIANDRHQKVWDECLPINTNGTQPLRLYFDNRGFLAVINELARTDSVRFHQALPYFEEDEEGSFKEIDKFPAIVAAVRDVEGNLLTLHRIYLSKQGKKAPVTDAKKMMSIPEGVDINGGAIQMGKPFNGILGVAEGLETALAAYRATGIPVWSTINAQLMKTFKIPDDVNTLLIWADLDKSMTGQIAANVLKSRAEAEGVNVIVMLPQYPIPSRAKSLDWNDVLLEQGRAGFPSRSHIVRFCEQLETKVFA